MKSPEVYRLLRSELGSWFKGAGFVRAKGLLSWCRSRGDAYTVVFFQVSQEGWDPYAGSKFVVNFQRSAEPVPGMMPSRDERLAGLLGEDSREELRGLQNTVIKSLALPPDTYFALSGSESAARWYRNKFAPDDVPYSTRHDVWLRYASPDHVRAWSRFILAQLPACVATTESWV